MHIGVSVWLGLTLLIAPITSTLAEAASTAATTQFIDVDGHKIAFHVTPGHEPTIVLDAGGGADSSYWDTLVPELSKRTGSIQADVQVIAGQRSSRKGIGLLFHRDETERLPERAHGFELARGHAVFGEVTTQ